MVQDTHEEPFNSFTTLQGRMTENKYSNKSKIRSDTQNQKILSIEHSSCYTQTQTNKQKKKHNVNDQTNKSREIRIQNFNIL